MLVAGQAPGQSTEAGQEEAVPGMGYHTAEAARREAVEDIA